MYSRFERKATLNLKSLFDEQLKFSSAFGLKLGSVSIECIVAGLLDAKPHGGRRERRSWNTMRLTGQLYRNA